MDLSKYNRRARAEEGVFVGLRDEYTGEPITDGDKQPGFIVRGLAARSVQSRLAEMQRKAAADIEGSGDDTQAVLERLHENLIESAMSYIVRAQDIEADGAPVGDDAAKIRSVLDMTFPDMQIVKDADGNNVTTTTKDKDGNEVEVPKFELVNEPFAQQVIKAAEDGQRFFGGTSSA